VANQKHDYTKLEQEFVTSKLSIREIGRRNDIPFGSIAEYARSHDWTSKRAAYQSSLSRRTYERVADEVANEEAAITKESVLVLRATLRRYAEQLKDGVISVTPKDAVLAIQTLSVMLTNSDRDEGNIIEGSVAPERPDAEWLRRVVDVARSRAAAGDVAADFDERAEGTLVN
jgi:hypothetical protein